MFKTYRALMAKAVQADDATPWYRIEAKADDVTEIFIYDEIGYWGITAADFVRDLQRVTSAKIKVRLNTPGGSVFDGVAIYNALLNHAAEIEVWIDGLAASMGSIIALAGSTVNMAENAFFMIHNPWSIVAGDAAAMRKEADILDKITSGSLVNTYMSRSGKDEAEVRALMDAETWFTAEEALAAGFIDTITGQADKAAMARFDLSVFARAPVALKQPAPPQPEKEDAAAADRVVASLGVRRKRLELMDVA